MTESKGDSENRDRVPKSAKESNHNPHIPLTPREKAVLIRRFGLYGEKEASLKEVAAILNMSLESVRQIEAKAIRKIHRNRIEKGKECNHTVPRPEISDDRRNNRPLNSENPQLQSALMNFAGMKVLITDDDNLLTKTLATIMKERFPRIEVEIANDGAEALEHIETGPPSLLILGMMMPRMGGAEVLIELRKKGLKIPVITMSGYVRSKAEVAKRAAVPIDSFEHLSKPFDIATFIDLAQRMLTPERA